MKTSKQDIEQAARTFLEGTGYELITLDIDSENNILVEVDSLKGSDVDFCAELNRHLVAFLDGKNEPDYSLEVGSVSLTAPFKTKMQYEKHLGQDVEVLVEIKNEELKIKNEKYRGQLVSVDDETFSVDVEEKVAVEGKKRKQTQINTHTWRYDEVEYCKYDLKF